MEQRVLGHECRETGFDAAAKLPGEKAEELRGGAQKNGDGEISKADSNAVIDICGGNKGLNKVKCAGQSARAPQNFAKARQDKQPALRLQQVRNPPLGHALGSGRLRTLVRHGDELEVQMKLCGFGPSTIDCVKATATPCSVRLKMQETASPTLTAAARCSCLPSAGITVRALEATRWGEGDLMRNITAFRCC